MSIEKILDEAKNEDFQAAVVVGVSKDGTIKLLSHPDNVMVASFLLSRAQFELHLFNVQQKPDAEAA